MTREFPCVVSLLGGGGFEAASDLFGAMGVETG